MPTDLAISVDQHAPMILAFKDVHADHFRALKRVVKDSFLVNRAQYADDMEPAPILADRLQPALHGLNDGSGICQRRAFTTNGSAHVT